MLLVIWSDVEGVSKDVKKLTSKSHLTETRSRKIMEIAFGQMGQHRQRL